MKVILKEAVGGLGKAGDVVEVKTGYAQNYLVPRGMAEAATKGALKDWEMRRSSIVRKEAVNLAEAQELAESLRDKEITVSARAGEGGKLYGSITSKEVAEAIESQLKATVDRKKVEIAESIKDIGVHPVTVKLYPGVDTTIQVNVVESKEE